MKWTFFLFLLGNILQTSGQVGYSVYYNRNDVYSPISFNGEKKRLQTADHKLVFSDSLSFFYSIAGAKDPLKGEEVYGSKLMHHAMLYNKNSDLVYSEVNGYPTKKDKYLVVDSSTKYDWIFLDDTKMLLGYKCKPALVVNEKNDSTLVWYTPEIPQPFGPMGLVGLPGLILEVYDQRYGIHMFAEWVEKGNFSVVFPTEGLIISRKEYLAARKMK